MSGRSRHVWYIVFGVVIVLAVAGIAYAVAIPHAKVHILLSSCFFSPQESKGECAFRIMERKIEEEGIVPAFDVFLVAKDMFPEELDLDCHNAAHRLGDTVYYSMFFGGNTEISEHEYPARTMVCNRGFYHGLFEHLFQDRPDPQFIVETCNYFKTLPDPALHEVARTCFHATGHGVFRYQTENVRVEDYGKFDAFVERPVELCKSLPGASEREIFNCIGGIQSLSIITSLKGDYDLKDPDPNNPYAICELFDVSLHSQCWHQRSIMLSHMDSDYPQALARCAATNPAFFQLCIRGIIIGVFTNGATPERYSRLITFCSEELIVARGVSEFCYEHLALQVGLEYLEHPLDCREFPLTYRDFCTAALET